MATAQKTNSLGAAKARSTAKAASVFLLPAILLIALYILYPIFDTFYLSGFKWNGISSARQFTGLDNWKTLLTDSNFWAAFQHNIIIMICSILLQIPIGVLLATFLDAGGKKLPIDQAPILIADNPEDIPAQLKPVTGKPLHFTLSTRMENPIHNEIVPFFEIHDSRYMMYWLTLSEKSYKEHLDAMAKAEREKQLLEERTVDKVQPGEQQPETDHKMETDRSNTGNTNDVFWRDARDGHFFSYLMQTNGLTNLQLRLKFWGVGEWKSHEFDIFIDDQLVKSVNNTGKYRISEFKYETYDIPEELLKGKTQVRVKFVAKPGKQIGEIYGVRLIKPQTENQ